MATCYEESFHFTLKSWFPELVKELRKMNRLKAVELKMKMGMPLGVRDIEEAIGGGEL